MTLRAHPPSHEPISGQPARLPLAHLPTPLWRHPKLDQLLGTELWVKRDDQTAGVAAGNKIRKLEFLLAEAAAQGADAVLTCGGAQSNHARATAALCRQLQLECHLLLRSEHPAQEAGGNLLLCRLLGARIHWLSPEQYARRQEAFAELERELELAGRRPYSIPEGGSNALGAWGYIHAMAEVRAALDRGEAGGAPFNLVVAACGSGGTAAGAALGAAHFGVSKQLWAMAVCDSRPHFERRIAQLCRAVRSSAPLLAEPAAVRVQETSLGPGYSVASSKQLRFIVEAARLSGLVLDPVYSGKALAGLFELRPLPPRVLFIHTGGLPGLLAQAGELEPHLMPASE